MSRPLQMLLYAGFARSGSPTQSQLWAPRPESFLQVAGMPNHTKATWWYQRRHGGSGQLPPPALLGGRAV
eukprot:4359462-Alexandrium_andersonii.AAC.1